MSKKRSAESRTLSAIRKETIKLGTLTTRTNNLPKKLVISFPQAINLLNRPKKGKSIQKIWRVLIKRDKFTCKLAPNGKDVVSVSLHMRLNLSGK